MEPLLPVCCTGTEAVALQLSTGEFQAGTPADLMLRINAKYT